MMSEEEKAEFADAEQQRKALEEMSQRLLDKLDAMVAEQEARAKEFAERSHSLSSLPQGISLPELPSVPQQSVPTPAPAVQALPPAQPKQKSVTPPPAAPQQKAASAPPPVHRPVPKAEAPSEGSISVGTLVLIGAGVFLLLRSCS